MNGLSGIKIYNKLHVDTRFLPKAYGSTVDLIVTGVSHKLQNNDWETDIEATLIPQTTNIEPTIISAAVISDSIQDVSLNDTGGIVGAAMNAIQIAKGSTTFGVAGDSAKGKLFLKALTKDQIKLAVENAMKSI